MKMMTVNSKDKIRDVLLSMGSNTDEEIILERPPHKSYSINRKDNCYRLKMAPVVAYMSIDQAVNYLWVYRSMLNASMKERISEFKKITKAQPCKQDYSVHGPYEDAFGKVTEKMESTKRHSLDIDANLPYTLIRSARCLVIDELKQLCEKYQIEYYECAPPKATPSCISWTKCGRDATRYRNQLYFWYSGKKNINKQYEAGTGIVWLIENHLIGDRAITVKNGHIVSVIFIDSDGFKRYEYLFPKNGDVVFNNYLDSRRSYTLHNVGKIKLERVRPYDFVYLRAGRIRSGMYFHQWRGVPIFQK